MQILIAFALILTIALSGMALYVKSQPPEASGKGVFRLLRGLRLGTISAVAVLLLFIAIRYFLPPSPSLFWTVMLFALAGNILNLISLVYCLRELNGKSILGGFLVLLNQLLWILFAIRAMPDF